MATMIYTIGYGRRPFHDVHAMLRHYGVSAVADVRTTPYSRDPSYRKEILSSLLRRNNIAYVFLGAELGFSAGAIGNDARFQSGVDRVMKGAMTYCVALLCVEQDPIHCHRSVLIGRALAQRGSMVQHILGLNSVESQQATMQRLMARVGLPLLDLFASPEELEDLACRVWVRNARQRMQHRMAALR